MGWQNRFPPTGGHPPRDSFSAEDLGVPSSAVAGVPGSGPNGVNAGQLEPNSRIANIAAGVPYQLVPAYPPFVRLANSRNVAYFPRFRSLTFGGGATAAGTTTQLMQFSLPTIVFARSGSAFLADDSDLPVGRTGLQTFGIQCVRTGGIQDLLDVGGGTSGPSFITLAENVLGPAGLPALIPGMGWFFDTGSSMNTTVQILLDNVRADVTFWCIEEYGAPRG